MNGASPQAIVIGASAGALEALSTILPALPSGYALPVLVVVHLPPGKDSLLVPLLRAKCNVPVEEAEDKQPIQPGTVYVAPPDYHLLVERDHILSLSAEEPVHYSRPSIDVLFETAADCYGPSLVGVVLTGANGDGARGLRAICDARGTALVQRPELSASPEMPRAALEACPEARAMSLGELAETLVKLYNS
jgi:two-component system chemotaxis response regulator CheB